MMMMMMMTDDFHDRSVMVGQSVGRLTDRSKR
jgi:hypothetical protein